MNNVVSFSYAAKKAAFISVMLYFLAGCMGSRPTDIPPDEQYGHRFDENATDGRRTLSITAPDNSQSYFYYPAPVDTVHIRTASFNPDMPAAGQEIAVEILVKGGLPDACSELHHIEQQRIGHIVDITLEIRRTRGAVCATVIRPYRFYVQLDGTYEQGSYTLRLNDQAYNFVIRAPEEN